jgi:chromosome segregation ATPase
MSRLQAAQAQIADRHAADAELSQHYAQAQQQVVDLRSQVSRLESQLQSHAAGAAELEAELVILREKVAEQQLHNLRLKTALERNPSREAAAEPLTPVKQPIIKEVKEAGVLAQPRVIPVKPAGRSIDLPGFLRP